MKKILLTLMISMILLTCISALDEDYIGKQYTSLNLIETCEVNGFACDNTFTCNITIVNPNHEVIVLNDAMTRNDTIYNYLLTNTSILGEYLTEVYCTNVTLSGKNVDGKITVTTTGRVPNIKLMTFLIISSFLLFLLALYIKNNAIGFMSGVLFIMVGTYIMIYGFGDIADMYTRALALIAIGFGSFIAIIAGLEWISEIEG